MGAIIFAAVVAAIALAIVVQSAVHRRRIARGRVRVDLAIRERLDSAHGPMDLRQVLDEALTRAGDGVDVYGQILDRVTSIGPSPRSRPTSRSNGSGFAGATTT